MCSSSKNNYTVKNVSRKQRCYQCVTELFGVSTMFKDVEFRANGHSTEHRLQPAFSLPFIKCLTPFFNTLLMFSLKLGSKKKTTFFYVVSVNELRETMHQQARRTKPLHTIKEYKCK